MNLLELSDMITEQKFQIATQNRDLRNKMDHFDFELLETKKCVAQVACKEAQKNVNVNKLAAILDKQSCFY